MSKESNSLLTLTWSPTNIGEALEALARYAGLAGQPRIITADQRAALVVANEEQLAHGLALLAQQLGLEIEPVQTTYAEASHLVQGAAPALLQLPGAVPHFFVLLYGGRQQVALLGTDFATHWVAVEQVRAALCAAVEAPQAAAIEQLLINAAVPEQRRHDARRVILQEQLGAMPIRAGWLVRLPPGANLWRLAQQARLFRPVWTLLAGYVVLQLLVIGSWWMIGRGALAGHFEWAWLLGWGLLLVTTVPFQMLITGALSRVAVDSGALFKQRLLYGALHLNMEEVRDQGAGQFLGRVLESEAVEQLALTGGLTAVLAVIQLMAAGVVLALGAGGWLHACLLLIWLLVVLTLGWFYLRRSRAWVESYRTLTNDLVERMVGHRTRLAQEERSRWYMEEDQLLDHYWQLSARVDQINVYLNGLVGRGWMLVGLAGLALGLAMTPTAQAKLAVSLGGVLLAGQALSTLSNGLQSIVGARIAWTQIRPLFQAATQLVPTPALSGALSVERQAGSMAGQPVIMARELTFRYRAQGRLILHECHLQIGRGDRLLLEGPSGGGKSTLVALLAGLRTPEAGLLLLWGFDHQTLGLTEWRRRVVIVPQFHENYVFTGSLAFNLLMGRQWPPSAEDLVAATALCQALGLGELIDRMPAGLQQMVGESGWQLSHGERSRLYIARALLQDADLVILDESFGALDPENLQRTLACVLQRAPTLLVIAHP